MLKTFLTIKLILILNGNSEQVTGLQEMIEEVGHLKKMKNINKDNHT